MRRVNKHVVTGYRVQTRLHSPEILGYYVDITSSMGKYDVLKSVPFLIIVALN